MTYLLTATG